MAKPKLSLSIAPTFKAPATIAIPGAKPVDVQFTFIHRTQDELKEFIDNGMRDLSNVELIQAVASGWELDDAFTTESLEQLTQNYPGSSLAIVSAYLAEMAGARVKN